jgi:hypothetical protein
MLVLSLDGNGTIRGRLWSRLAIEEDGLAITSDSTKDYVLASLNHFRVENGTVAGRAKGFGEDAPLL